MAADQRNIAVIVIAVILSNRRLDRKEMGWLHQKGLDFYIGHHGQASPQVRALSVTLHLRNSPLK